MLDGDDAAGEEAQGRAVDVRLVEDVAEGVGRCWRQHEERVARLDRGRIGLLRRGVEQGENLVRPGALESRVNMNLHVLTDGQTTDHGGDLYACVVLVGVDQRLGLEMPL